MEPEFANPTPIENERRDPLEAAYGDVTLSVETRIGSFFLPVRELLKLRIGDVIESQKVVGEPMDIYMEGRLMARGEVVVVNERYGVRISEVARTDEVDPPDIPSLRPRGEVIPAKEKAAPPATGKREEAPPKTAKAATQSPNAKRDADKAAKPSRRNKRATKKASSKRKPGK